MGTAEEQTPSKPSKATTSVQETPTTVSPYPDWSSSMQTYYGASAAPFFVPPVASPATHPYMWGGQHPMMPPPYGMPVHYPPLYPPGGVYAQPTIGMATNTTTGVEAEGKNADIKDQTSAKKPKGNSDVRDEHGTGTEKGASGSGNEGASQSAESGSEGSSDASDDNDNQQESGINKKGSFDQMLAEGAHAQSNGVNGKHVTAMPATNLNIGMDLWNASPAGVAKVKPCTGVSSAPVPGMVGLPDHQWIQDEREIKRQKRKQSNRESARRSRLRKQAECEELQRRVESLNSENSTLREELGRLASECKKLSSENESIKEELTRLCGPTVVSSLAEKNSSGEGR